MSIIIQNVSEQYGKGTQDYVLRINQKVIARFQHVYEDGLAECLRKAAKAAEDPFRQEVMDENQTIKALVEAVGR